MKSITLPAKNKFYEVKMYFSPAKFNFSWAKSFFSQQEFKFAEQMPRAMDKIPNKNATFVMLSYFHISCISVILFEIYLKKASKSFFRIEIILEYVQ